MIVCRRVRAHCRIAAARFSGALPDSSANSVSLATTIEAVPATADVVSRNGAVLRIEVTPCSRASARARIVASCGTSCWTISTSVSPRPASAVSASARSDLAVGAGQDADLVLAVRVDEDHRNALRGIDPAHVPELDAARFEERERLVAHAIAPSCRDHPHARPGAPGRQRLVGALAARRGRKGRAHHRFARHREAADPADEIEHYRTEHGDHAMAFRIVFQLRAVRSAALGMVFSRSSRPPAR